MQPVKQQVHIDKPLTDFTIAAMQSASDFVAAQVIPSLAVSKQTDRYFKFNSGDFHRDAAQRRAAGTESAGTGFNLSDDSYSCEKYALHVDFDYDTLANADDPLNLEQAAAEQLSLAMLIRREKMFATAAWGTSKWSTSVLGNASTQWSAYTTSDPIVVIDQQKKAVRQKIFVEPNTLILGEDVYLALKEHPDLVGRVQYTSSAILNEASIAQLLGVERIFVAKALENVASEGLTDSNSAILSSKAALLCYLPKTVGLMNKSAIVSFDWTGSPNLPRGTKGVITRRFDLGPEIGARRIETEIATQIKVTLPDAGCYFADIVA